MTRYLPSKTQTKSFFGSTFPTSYSLFHDPLELLERVALTCFLAPYSFFSPLKVINYLQLLWEYKFEWVFLLRFCLTTCLPTFLFCWPFFLCLNSECWASGFVSSPAFFSLSASSHPLHYFKYCIHCWWIPNLYFQFDFSPDFVCVSNCLFDITT